MRVIPVLDLKGGCAVHARRGERDRYQPVHSRLSSPPGDAVALARGYRDTLSLEHLYVADLDAISGGVPQRELVRTIAGLGGDLLLDAGIATADDACRAIEDGAGRVVIGLETLVSFAALPRIVRAVGGGHVVFSLDLRSGEPIIRVGARDAAGQPLALARQAVDAGVAAVLVLDLARVGTGSGLDLALIARIRRALPEIELLAGGGVRGREDLERLAAAGCNAVLLGSALHEGWLSADDVHAICSRSAPQ